MTHTRDIRFAREADQPSATMQRTRDACPALGYGNPYVWAQPVSTYTSSSMPSGSRR